MRLLVASLLATLLAQAPSAPGNLHRVWSQPEAPVMALTLDVANLGGNTAGSGTTVAFTTTSAVAAGGRVVVCGGWFSDNTSVTSVTDNGAGLTWAIDKQAFSTVQGVYMASALAPTGLASGTTITVHFGASVTAPTVSGIVLGGVDTSSPVDGTPVGPVQVTTAVWSSGNLTTSGAAAIVAVSWNEGAVTSNTPTSPSVEAHERLDGTDHFGHVVEVRIETAAGTYSVGGTWNAAHKNTTIAVPYKAAAGGGTPATLRLLTLLGAG